MASYRSSKSYKSRQSADISEFLYNDPTKYSVPADVVPHDDSGGYDKVKRSTTVRSRPDYSDLLKRSPVSTNTDTAHSPPQVDQLLSLVKQLNKIDIESVESSLKDKSSPQLKSELQKREQDYQELKEMKDQLQIKYDKACTIKEELIVEAKKLIKEAKQEIPEEHEEKLNQLKRRLNTKEEEVKQLQIEKQSALSRLSKEMGEKLNDNNPGIADLSDPNRSTKVAEKYNSLYDNEWTDALESLGFNKIDEEDGVKILLEIKKHIYTFCTKTMTEMIQDLKNTLVNPLSRGRYYDDRGDGKEDKQIRQMLDTCIKMKAQTTISNLQKSYNQMSQKPRSADKLPEYVNKCVEVCWLMNTQRPPLILAEPLQVGQTIDTFQYKEFTKHGDTVSFVVWLPLLIEKDGAVLTKGVVQPVPKVVTKVPKSKPKGAWTSDKVKSRSRQETQEEQTQRLLNDNDGTSYMKRHDSSGEHRYATRTHEREKYDSDLTGHRQKFDEHVSRRQADPQVDDIFQDSYYRNRTTNIGSSGISPSSISHPYSQNITTSTYGDRFTNTRVSERTSSAYREQHKDRPSSTYSEQHKDRSDYLNQRSVKTGSSDTASDRGSVLNINPSNAEIFEAGTGHKYALYGGKFYAQDNHSGSWRFASGFNSDSQA